MEQGSFGEAESIYRLVTPAGYEFPEIFKNLADCLMRQDRLEASVLLYEKAIDRRPGYLNAHINLAHVLKRLSRHAEAVPHYQRALVLDPTLASLKPALARCLTAVGQFEPAAALYSELIASFPLRIDVQAEAGLLYANLGNLEAAEAQFGAAIALNPRLPALYLGLARVRRFSEEDPYLKSVLALLVEPSWSRAERMYLSFAAGIALDQIGHRERAFAHFAEANRLKREATPYDEAAELQQILMMPRLCGEAFLRSAATLPGSTAEPIFIVGMPRSGSTLVEQILSSHSEVQGLREVSYFSDALNAVNLGTGAPRTIRLDPDRLGAVAQAYLSQVDAVHSSMILRRTTDKMLSNFKYVGLIHAALPHAKIIHTRRDPIDTCLSCFFTDFAEPLNYSYDLTELGRYYRAYQTLMNYWKSALPSGSILGVRYEYVVADTPRAAQDILRFCGLAWDDRCLRFFENKRPVLTASGAQVRRPIYKCSVNRGAAYAQFIGPLVQALGPTNTDL